MKRSLLRITIAFALALAAVAHADEAKLRRIAFGSCNAGQYPQPIWKAVVESNPDLWIWTGDIVYAKEDSSIESLRSAYATQKERPEYLDLRRNCRVIGVWDDHDYGLDNGGAENPIKSDAQAALLDFLDEPADSPRRKQAGVYAKYSFGPVGQRVQIILLDTRYHREAPGPKADVLGAEQWQWLEQTLRNDDAEITFLISSIQVIPTEQKFEKWANFPASRERLLRLIGESGKCIVILSGDRHIAESSSLELPEWFEPLTEVTSSGLTHSWKDFPGEPNQHRYGSVFSDLNFGWIEINWNTRPVNVTIEIRDVDGVPRRRGGFPLSKPHPPVKGTRVR